MSFFKQIPSWVNWSLAFPLICLNGWLLIVIFEYFHSIITVVITAMLISFILNYPVEFLSNHKIKRHRAVFYVVAITFVLIAILGITLAPLIFSQLNELALRLPSWIESGGHQLEAFNQWAINHKIPINLMGVINQLTAKLSGEIQAITGQILGFLLGTVGSVFDLVLTLVLTFYLLLHGEQLWDGLGQWLPDPWGDNIRSLLSQNFHNYYVGQASLAAIIGVTMTCAFFILQVPFALLFGLGVGFLALFPFGAAFSICIVGLLIALKSFWLGIKVLIVAIILEQIIENGVAPRLLGGFIGLNPIWILLSLLIGAKIGGIIGLLIAVPLAGFIKNIANMYRINNFYLSEK